jgi:16S rRNA (cytosine1402-N4)-methyltransferase
MLKAIGQGGRLIGLDRDPMMLGHAAAVISTAPNVSLHQSSYVEMPLILRELGIDGVDRILLDLGLSSDQLADEQRGYGFNSDGPLDLRFDISKGSPAADLVANASESDLEQIFREFGEESLAAPIAAWLVSIRATRPIRTGKDLSNAVAECPAVRRHAKGDKNPATRIFQALRIAVNQELDHVQQGISSSCYGSLKPGGILAVISFHSLEDRIVKNEFRDRERWEQVTDKPITATPQELRFNPRSRSAKLRVARKHQPSN